MMKDIHGLITMATAQEKMKQLKENVEKIEGMSGSESLTRFLRVQKTK